jgi:hypothetical protein
LDLPAIYLAATLFAHITLAATAATTTTASYRTFSSINHASSPIMCTRYMFHYSKCGHVTDEVVRCAGYAAMGGYCPDGGPHVVNDYHDGYCNNH